MELDPVKYEIFRHRLFHILEEGRSAMINVSGSPVIAEGGECMTSIYDGEGNHVLTAGGLLFHCTGCGEAVAKTIEMFEPESYIEEGDQFYYNDPYVAGSHVYDQLIVKPIFYKGRRVGWAGSMMHTSDTGGMLRGASTEIYHEGVRWQGLKLVAGNKLRPDTFKNAIEQCRDPDYVGLDLKARIAANNVCEKGYLGLVEKFGTEFTDLACQKLIREGEELARARLRSLPDGTWRSRVYFGEAVHPHKIVCTVTKKGEEIIFDGTGSDPQQPNYENATYHGTWGMLFTVIAGQLFWDVPWNGGMTKVVKLIVQEGSILNCRYPAACGLGTSVGSQFAMAAHECVAKLLYAGGVKDDVTSAWGSLDGHTGPGWFYGGHSQFGLPVGQGIYDNFSLGQGATPNRDGVDSGGSSQNAQSMISDVEFTEMNYPFVYLARNQMMDHAGFGKFAGGAGPERLMMAYGSKDLTVNYLKKEYPPRIAGFGLFGGYPIGRIVESRNLMVTKDMAKKMTERQRYPVTLDDMDGSWGRDIEKTKDAATLLTKTLAGYRAKMPEYSIIQEAIRVGGGYGDPLDRDPNCVVEDIRQLKVSVKCAAENYGVIVDANGAPDEKATVRKRQQIRDRRVKEAGGQPIGQYTAPRAAKKSLRVHEYLEVMAKGKGSVIRCVKCGNEFGSSKQNYKKHALKRTREISPSGAAMPDLKCWYHEYLCPGCGTLLQVDSWIPGVDKDEPIWDIQVEL